MKQTLNFLLLLGITALLAGCKLAVIVVEGGEVQSIGSGTCVAGSICIVDVDDPNFSERFKAVPDEGWYFHKWNSGGRFLCESTTNPNCAPSFEGYKETKAVEDMVASSDTFYLMPVFKRYKGIITVNGKQWLQPKLFYNASLTYADINAVCPAGVCRGELNGIDMTGWTWASVDHVNALFNHYIGRDELGPGPDSYQVIPGLDGNNFENFEWPVDSFATEFFSDGWRDFLGPNYTTMKVAGFTRSLSDDSSPYAAQLMFGSKLEPETETEGIVDLAETDVRVQIESTYFGAWFYRAP